MKINTFTSANVITKIQITDSKKTAKIQLKTVKKEIKALKHTENQYIYVSKRHH